MMEYWNKKGGDRKGLWLAMAILAAFVLGFLLRGGGHEASRQTDGKTVTESPAGQTHEHGKEDIDYWTCSMHPWIHLPEPGKCPICSMDLIPVFKKSDRPGQTGDALSLREVSLSPAAAALAQVETSPVVNRVLDVDTRLMGKVEYDETRQAYITAWTGGRLDRLYVDHTGETVKKGQTVAEIYSPELYAAQAELLEAVKAAAQLKNASREYIRDAGQRTEQAAREKLRLLGFGRGMADQVVARGKPSDHVTLTAPIGGVVTSKDVQEGQYVMTGARLYSIADLSHVWVVLRAYESDQPFIKMGAEVRFEAEGIPGKTFTGKVVFIDPVITDKSRTFRVRLDVPNPDGALKPDMLVHAVQQAGQTVQAGAKSLAVPASAVLLTGKRAVVYVAVPGQPGVYEGREIVVGPRAGDWYVVERGLAEGESVVTKGSFAIDSSAQLQAKPSMMNPEGGEAQTGMANMPGMESKDGKGSGTKAPAAPALPPAFVEKLAPLDEAFKAVSTAVEAGDVQRYRDACKAFSDALMAVPPAGLTPVAMLVWKDLSMLLGNDTVIGRDTGSITEARWQLAEMADHLKRLKAAFPSREVSAMPKPKPLASMPVQHEVAVLYKAYLALQQALAKDDGPGAVKAAKDLAGPLAAVDAAKSGGQAAAVWTEARNKMDEGLKIMTAAKDTEKDKAIETVRKGFYLFSQGLSKAVSTLGSMGAGKIYEIFCPMAFDGEGATWLQPDPAIRNPYLGPDMGDCGEVKGRVDLGE